MPTVKTWFAASRPFSFTAAAVPAIVGTLLAAEDAFSWWRALLVLFGSVLFLAGTNFVNDYYDHATGADGPESMGMAGFIQRGILTPRQVLTAGFLCFASGGAMGLVLCATGSWQILWIGVASALAGFLYTGWPVHLAYIGLGEVTVFLFMGPVIVVGAYFVQTESWDWQPFVASLPIAFLVTAILHANNLRDIDLDKQHGKRTVATLIGRSRANIEMYVLLACTYVALVASAAVGAMPWAGLLALATLPLVRPIVDVIRAGGSPRKLNAVLRDTAQLHMKFGAMLAVGLGLNWIWVSL